MRMRDSRHVDEVLESMTRFEDKMEKRMSNIEDRIATVEIHHHPTYDYTLANQTVTAPSHCCMHGHKPISARPSHQLAESIELIGLREAITTKQRALRHVWLFLFLVGIGATVFFLYATATEYLEEPTVTKVKIISQATYEYPPIVLCHDAWFDMEKAFSMGMTKDALVYSLGFWQYAKTLNLTDIAKGRAEFQSVYQKLNFTGLVSYYKAIATDMLPVYTVQAFVNASAPMYLATKGVPLVKTILLPFNPVCYAFTLRPLEGHLGVLFDPERIVIRFEDRTGGLIPISPTWFLFLETDANTAYTRPMAIPAGKTSVLRIKPRKYSALNKPEAPCTSKNGAGLHYTGARCMAACANRLYKQAVACEIVWLANDDDQQPPRDFCNYFDYSALIPNPEAVHHELVSKIRAGVKKTCYTECPRRCERFLYDTAITENVKLKEFQDVDIIRQPGDESITALHIIHEAMQLGGILTITEEESYTFTELINNIGGTLGLFVGGTLMTLFQLILFAVNYLCERRGDALVTVRQVEQGV